MNKSKDARLLLVTTVPETFATILKDQPRFLAQSFNVSLVCSPGKDVDDVRRNEGVLLAEVPMVRGISPFRDLISIFRMCRVLYQFKPHVVHSYTPKAGLVAMLAGWLCRVPIRMHTFTGLVFPTATGVKRHLLLFVDKFICGCATNVIPEGLGVKSDLQRFRVTKKRLNVIGYGNIAGVDTAYFDPHAFAIKREEFQKTILSVDNEVFVFCFVGRVNRDKGLRELTRAFSSLPSSAHLLVVGALDQTAPIDNETLSLIKSHSRVHWLGFQSDIRPALCAANVLVLPSYREGFPNVVLQAGAMELPVIATDISGCNEVIEPGVNGWLVPVRNEGALAGSMLAAMQTSPSALMRMGADARRRIQERHERSTHWERMERFYGSLMQQMECFLSKK